MTVRVVYTESNPPIRVLNLQELSSTLRLKCFTVVVELMLADNMWTFWSKATEALYDFRGFNSFRSRSPG